MKILGIIGSARKRGNCELLIKEALIQAQDQGAKIRAVRLSDFKLLPCKGCLACVLKGESCRLDDDMHELWKHLEWADGIILSAPTYFLGPTGIVKLFIDRLFEYSLQLSKIKRRPGAIIATAGLPDWDPFTLPILTMLAGILQLDLVDRFMAYRPGPGEVLLDEETMERARAIGTLLIEQTHKPRIISPLAVQANSCPQCGTPFIQLRETNKVECQLCQAEGFLEIKGNNVSIKWDSKVSKNRWSPGAMAEHFADWVIRTGPVFQKYRDQIQTKIQKYSRIEITTTSKEK
ncbi:MAG: flavodoxin family protein [Candidatus Thorarchaeota archaeon]